MNELCIYPPAFKPRSVLRSSGSTTRPEGQRSDPIEIIRNYYSQQITPTQTNPLLGEIPVNHVIEAMYKTIPEVMLITSDREGDLQIFEVFTSNLIYNDKLMDILIDKEIQILDLYPNHLIYFQYRTYNPADQKNPSVSVNRHIIHQK